MIETIPDDDDDADEVTPEVEQPEIQPDKAIPDDVDDQPDDDDESS